MANEISFTQTLQGAKAFATRKVSKSASVSMSGDDFVEGTQLIGTSAETIGLGDIGTPGFCQVTNLDAANYVEFGPDGTTWFVKTKAGETSTFRVTSAAIYGRANSAACRVEFLVFED